MTQLTADDVRRLTAEGRYGEVNAARLRGDLNALLGGEAPLEPDAQATRADVNRLYAERRYCEIDDLRRAGRLDDLLNGRTPPPEPSTD